MAQTLYKRVKSPCEICGDTSISLDTNVIVDLFKEKSYCDETRGLLMDPVYDFAIDTFQRRCIKQKGYGPELNELSVEMDGRLYLLDPVSRKEFDSGMMRGEMITLYDDLVRLLREFHDRRVSDPRWVKRRIERFKPPQFKKMGMDSFDQVHYEDIYVFLTAVHYELPVLMSQDRHMKAISLITEVGRPVYEDNGLTIPHIIHPSYAFSDPLIPKVNKEAISGEVEEWYESIDEMVEEKPESKHEPRITVEDFLRAHYTWKVT